MKKYFWTVLPAVIIIGALIGGVFIYQTGSKERVVQEAPPPLETPVVTPETLKREDLKLQVLNGRGTAGTADEAKKYLQSLGYQDIEVDNADSFDFAETEISIKQEQETYLDLLKEDLSEKYVLSEKREILDAESDFDAVVVIGEK